MKNKILVLSKVAFDCYMISKNLDDSNIESKNICIISINSIHDIKSVGEPHFKYNHSNVLLLWFDDIVPDEIDLEDGKILKSFSKEQGEELIKFLDQNKDRNGYIVHCLAGVSRSAAVGLFICEYFGFDYNEFIKANSQNHPNRKVTKILHNLTIYKHYGEGS